MHNENLGMSFDQKIQIIVTLFHVKISYFINIQTANKLTKQQHSLSKNVSGMRFRCVFFHSLHNCVISHFVFRVELLKYVLLVMFFQA